MTDVTGVQTCALPICCWLNFFDPDELAKELGLPENEEVLMILDLGYAAEGAGPLANHGSRKHLSETVAYL